MIVVDSLFLLSGRSLGLLLYMDFYVVDTFQCKTGTKIVALNSLMREREDTEIMIDEDGKEIEVKIVRDVSEKAIGRGGETYLS